MPTQAGSRKTCSLTRLKIRGKKAASYTMALPPPLPYGREINSKLSGMKRGPFATTGVVADLDPSKVVGVAVYIKEPKLDWVWGVKRIVASTGPAPKVPAWMLLPPDKFFRSSIRMASSNTRTGPARRTRTKT